MILVVTSKRDGHIHWVTRYFDAIHHQWVRINIEDFSKNIDLSLNPASGTGSIWVRDSDRLFELNTVKAVWYRKPDPIDLSHFNLDRANLDYVEAEVNEIIHGLYALCNQVLWINNPFTTRIAHRKMLQLHVAKTLGLNTPRTLITNRIPDALEFAESVNWDVAIKSVGAISVSGHRDDKEIQYGIFTRRVGKEELLALQDKIPYLPTLFQEYIDKEYELRITCVGERIFACRIYSQESAIAREDFRFDSRNLKHELCECPQIADKLIAYLKIFGLNFGCFDIAYSKSGEFVFFECNPNGQWLWIEELTGAPISQAIANMLMTANK